MNEHIKELAKRSGAYIHKQNLTSKPVQYRESVELWDDNIEKFASLIIQECYKWVKENGGCSDDVDYQAMKEYFGVK